MPSLRTKNHSGSERSKLDKSVEKHKVDRQRNLIRFLKAGCRFYCIWPLKSNASRWRLALYEIVWWFYVAIESYSVLGIINGVHCCFVDLNGFVKTFVDVIFMLEVLFDLIYYKFRASEFQHLIIEMERFMTTPNSRHLILPVSFYYTVVGTFVVGSFLFTFTPLFSESQPTPLNTIFLFIPKENYWGRRIAYALEIVIVVIAGLVLFHDLMIVSIILHAGSKFGLLGAKLEKFRVPTEKKMRTWTREHQSVISCAFELNRIIAPIAIKSTIAVMLYVLVSALVIIHKLPLVELSKFLIVTLFAVLRFFACSWAADVMTEKARNISWNIYDAQWIDATINVRKSLLVITQRCQKGITIHVVGFISAWSLKFCGQVVYTIFTFFSTLRAALRV
ncbi:unnamed protein product [Xylocopa violacea]|uniref:Odorant receptor n=1 Tax=Xylocopa violacea TaxID=135666 RepID=A0ABP1NFP7_XYLVO